MIDEYRSHQNKKIKNCFKLIITFWILSRKYILKYPQIELESSKLTVPWGGSLTECSITRTYTYFNKKCVQCTCHIFSPLRIGNLNLVPQVYQESGKVLLACSSLHTLNNIAIWYREVSISSSRHVQWIELVIRMNQQGNPSKHYEDSIEANPN